MQEIYINLDDSGKLSNKEIISTYGGFIVLSKKEKDKFITQYRSIINEIKCKYCNHKCNNKCPEIKSINIKNKDKRRLFNYIKKYFLLAIIIDNNKVYGYIKDNKSAKGRYIDYALRRMIKMSIKYLIDNNKIDPYKPVKIIINIDEQPTKSNGYYSLKDGLYEELKYGISNYNYGIIITPILYSDIDIKLTYLKSDKSYVVQAADLLAGSVRKNILNNNNLDYVNIKLFLP